MKIIRIVFAAMISVLVAFGRAQALPPPNDLFADATLIESLDGEIEASFIDATPDDEPQSAAQYGASVWYRWTAPESVCMVFETRWIDSVVCPIIAVFTGSEASSAQLVAVDEGGGDYHSFCNNARVAFHAVAGTEYHLMLDGARAFDEPRVMLQWTFAGSGPDNDNFANAEPITGAVGSVAGSTISATQECGEAPGTGPDVWYSWIAPFTGRFAFTTDDSYPFDTILSVCEGEELGSLTCTSDDDGPDYTCCSGRPSKVVLDATEGDAYHIVVKGFVQSAGDFSLNWAPRPMNDDFGDAEDISGPSGSLIASNLAATHEEGEPLHTGSIGIFQPLRSVWYRWQAPSNGRVTFDPGGSNFFADVFVYTGSSVDALTPVDRVAPVLGSAASMNGYTFDAIVGTTYHVVLDGVSAGSVVLTWVTGAPPNDDVGNAQAIVGPSGTVLGNTLGASVADDEPNPAWGPPPSHTIWYRWDAPVDGIATFDSFGTSFNGVVAIYVGQTPASLSFVTSSWASGYAPPDAATFSVQEGNRYYMQLYGALGNNQPPADNTHKVGPTTLNWSLCADGVVDLGEQCDLGAMNGSAGACCSATCTFVAAATTCRAASGVCDVAESCTGSSASCPANVFLTSSTTCRASFGVCDQAETCNGAAAGCPADVFLASSTVCRAASGICDAAETCTGTGAACPADAFSGTTTVCRASAGVCDQAESCSGSSATCPANVFLTSATTCRASFGVCDVAESCTGSSASCPANVFLTSSTTCRASFGVCDQAETCNGAAAGCPADVFLASSTTCRASSGVCDQAETCDGAAAGCPADVFLASSTVCRAASGICDAAEACTGTDAACPADAFSETTTVCRTSAGVCDQAENCSGSSATCAANVFLTSAATCRAASGVCDVAETCTGSTNTCPADVLAANGIACNDGVFCNGPDTCSGGTCAIHAGNPCPGPDGDSNCAESCDEALDVCASNDTNGSACNDADECTSNDLCASGICAGTPVPGCPTTTTTLPPPIVCGDVNGDGTLTASDALAALRAAVGIATCLPEVCDFNGDGAVTASDALAILRVAVGQPVNPSCPDAAASVAPAVSTTTRPLPSTSTSTTQP